ncbi:uncharacterized protein LOC114300706 [Camellia sinensis]|uniref:uncharacterized protein LOC114300706 n=1 Tax=Camellia sinensis TaxID=4442 RepID=UPI001035B13B|nr:uncharacterized protein LOC114300706 [Camellia sinensis]
MGRPIPVAKDLLASLLTDVAAQPIPTQPRPKPKRVKKVLPKAKVTQIESEDTLPISKLAESDNSQPSAGKRRSKSQPSGSPKSKKPRSSSATTSGSKKNDVPWAPKITLEDKPVFASDSAEDINVGVALSTALLLPGDLERNAKMSEEKLAEARREISSLKKSNKILQSKMKTLEEQAEAAIKAQNDAEEKADSTEALRKVLEAEKREAEDKTSQAQKELQEALATKEAKIKDADEKAYAQGMADVTEAYEQQVKQACNRGFSLGWISLLKKLNVPEDSPLRSADAIPLPFPPPPPAPVQSNNDSESEDEEVDEALVKKSKDAAGAKSLPQNEQIDAEIAAEKAAEVSTQQSTPLSEDV